MRNFSKVDCSELVRQNLEVASLVKEEVFGRLSQQEDMPNEELDSIITEAIKTVTSEEGVEESTIRDALTRKIGCDMKTYRAELYSWLIGKDSKLVDRIVDNCSIKFDSPGVIQAVFRLI